MRMSGLLFFRLFDTKKTLIDTILKYVEMSLSALF